MNKDSVLKIAPYVLLRPEYSLNRLYLLNFYNDELWLGNLASYYILSQIDGTKTIQDIVSEVQQIFDNYSEEDLLATSLDVINGLVEQRFLILIKE